MTELLWLLLPVAAASGWWTAQRCGAPRRWRGRDRALEYFRGLSLLIDDKPDQTIELLSRITTLDPGAAEPHFALANLCRRRGEVDRAIRVHEQLIGRDGLTPAQQDMARWELAEDYLRAGLFDRAEDFYRAYVDDPQRRRAALQRLMDIYQRERDWERAIECCEALGAQACNRTAWAHYHCELADAARARGDAEAARREAARALERDAGSVRANLLLADLAMAAEDWSGALGVLLRVEGQDARYLAETARPLGRCLAALGRYGELPQRLVEWHARHGGSALAVAAAQAQAAVGGPAAALAFLERELARAPSLNALRAWAELRLGGQDGRADPGLERFYQAGLQLLEESARYGCAACGYTARAQQWCCPGCKTWGSVAPMQDLVCRTARS